MFDRATIVDARCRFAELLREHDTSESPAACRERNLLVSANALDRA